METVSNIDFKIDFEQLVRKHGYVRARQLVKRSTIEKHQTDVFSHQECVHQSFQKLRTRESTKLSRTAGGVGARSLVDKLLESNRSIAALESMLNGTTTGILDKVKSYERFHVPRDSCLSESRLQYSLNNPSKELLLPNAELEEFPVAISETIFLQINHIRQLKCVRNQFRSLVSDNLPQISINHFKYAELIDFSLNKVVRLPDNFGDLKYLQILNLSNNMISNLPSSFSRLTSLHTLDLSGNSFSVLPEDFGFIDSLTSLNLSENLFTLFPYAAIRLRNIKKLIFNKNSVSNLAILPPLLQEKDMWIPTVDNRTGKNLWMNILTREREVHIEHYSGEGVRNKKDLHVFQQENNVRKYRQRKLYLSVCQIYEWEPDTDITTGRTYYRNNVSSATSWTLPETLNCFGNMSSIQELTINNNAIKYIPSSFLKLTFLTKICLNRNRLEELPENIGELKALQYFELSNNELKLLPTSLTDCKELIVLLLDDNHLLRLPENIGFLPKLSRLDISHNRLRTIPFSLGYCSSLKTLRAHENPLEDPPTVEFEKSVLDISHILWYLRNRYLIEKHGKPPLMTFHNISINEEITILTQELNETIQTRLQSSIREGFLNLQLLGLKEIPPSILKSIHVKKIKLDFNPHLNLMPFGSEGFPRELRRINSLSIRGCKLTSIPQNIFIFERLTSINLEENLLESLPDGFTELVNITNINLSKNRLYQLPLAFNNLQYLQYLNLESNFLESIPLDIGLLKELKVLLLSKNRLTDFPEQICNLNSLRVLNIEKNQLIHLPKKMSMMNLIDLRVGHNYIEVLDEEFFSQNLGKSIKFFSCTENNLLEIPESIIYVDNLCMVELDYNPYITPPPYLLSEGLITIQNYFKIRQYRKRLLHQLMIDEDFELSIESFTPSAHEVLEDGSGFLTPEDLASFDQAVDEYLNGEFFKCPSTGEEIVASISKLREEREIELYLTIIRAFLGVVSQLVSSKDERFPESSIYTSQRSWGKDGEMCNVWVVSLQALLRETSPNVYYPNGRPSIFQLVNEALPVIAFPFTVDLLKDSLRLYISPYGTIADTEETLFPACDCMDEFRNKPKRHNPCNKAAVVVCKSCYVEEEAARRAVEEDELLEKFEELEDEVRVWILTEEGKALLEKEVKKRKAILKEEVQLREEMILSQQLKLKKANDQMRIIEARKIAFEQGATYDNHGFHSMEEAIQLLGKAEDEANLYNDRIELLKGKVKEINVQLELDWRASCRQAIADLIEKYCFITYEEAVKAFRRKALDNNLNRHWDGDEGQLFEIWKRTHLAQQEESLNPEIKPADEEEDSDIDKDDEEDQIELKPEFEWSNTNNMEKYKIYLFSTYRKYRPFNIEFK